MCSGSEEDDRHEGEVISQAGPVAAGILRYCGSFFGSAAVALHGLLYLWTFHNLAFTYMYDAVVNAAKDSAVRIDDDSHVSWLSILIIAFFFGIELILAFLAGIILLSLVGQLFFQCLKRSGADEPVVITVLLIIPLAIVYLGFALWFLMGKSPPQQGLVLVIQALVLEGVAIGVIVLALSTISMANMRYLVFLVFFLMNITLSLLWYRFRYQPSGTYRPDWTNIHLG
jgi:hypothetical protein